MPIPFSGLRSVLWETVDKRSATAETTRRLVMRGLYPRVISAILARLHIVVEPPDRKLSTTASMRASSVKHFWRYFDDKA